MICTKCNDLMRYNTNNNNGNYFTCRCGNTTITGYNPMESSTRTDVIDCNIDLVAERGRD